MKDAGLLAVIKLVGEPKLDADNRLVLWCSEYKSWPVPRRFDEGIGLTVGFTHRFSTGVHENDPESLKEGLNCAAM